MQKLVDWWKSVPKTREWWLDRFAEVSTGCFFGCGTILICYLASVFVCFFLAFVLVAENLSEATSMGFAWGSSLGLLVMLVLGSAFLSAVAWWRGA